MKNGTQFFSGQQDIYQTYLRKTDQKLKTARVIAGAISNLFSPSRSLRMICIGGGSGDADLRVAALLPKYSFEIENIDPSMIMCDQFAKTASSLENVQLISNQRVCFEDAKTKTLPANIVLCINSVYFLRGWRNRRWARQRGLSSIEGHKAGEKVIEPIALRCKELGIVAVSFYTLSTENLKRSAAEVEALLNVLRVGAAPMLERLAREDVRFTPLGDLDLFPEDIRNILLHAAGVTQNKQGMRVNLALGYGGRDEIVRAVRKITDDGVTGEAVTEKILTNKLDTAGQPDPELVIRSGGRARLSNFLTWQTVYSEIYFTDTLWPDFTVDEFNLALCWYQEQVRTFGR